MWVEEKSVHSPRKRFRSLVQIFKGRQLGKFAIVLSFNVVQMSLVFDFGIGNPGNAHSNWKGAFHAEHNGEETTNWQEDNHSSYGKQRPG